MSTTLIVIPPEDACVIAHLGGILARRLVNGNDAPPQRRSLLRALFGLQRLPVLIPDLTISISADRFQLEIDAEHCSFASYTEDWHTEFRIQYFAEYSHCIGGFDMLEGDEKIAAARQRLNDFEAAMEEVSELSIEDLSIEGAVDEPPIDDYLEYAQTYDTP